MFSNLRLFSFEFSFDLMVLLRQHSTCNLVPASLPEEKKERNEKRYDCDSTYRCTSNRTGRDLVIGLCSGLRRCCYGSSRRKLLDVNVSALHFPQTCLMTGRTLTVEYVALLITPDGDGVKLNF